MCQLQHTSIMFTPLMFQSATLRSCMRYPQSSSLVFQLSMYTQQHTPQVEPTPSLTYPCLFDTNQKNGFITTFQCSWGPSQSRWSVFLLVTFLQLLQSSNLFRGEKIHLCCSKIKETFLLLGYWSMNIFAMIMDKKTKCHISHFHIALLFQFFLTRILVIL